MDLPDLADPRSSKGEEMHKSREAEAKQAAGEEIKILKGRENILNEDDAILLVVLRQGRSERRTIVLSRNKDLDPEIKNGRGVIGTTFSIHIVSSEDILCA